jgi:uncharacterized membrane protein
VKIRHFLDQIEHDHVQTAIQAAEAHTRGRIVVYISHRNVADPLVEAQKLFRKLRIESERDQAGLLLFVAPKARKFAVLGGPALHAKLGQEWWDRLAEMVAKEFRQERFTEGILTTIDEAGRAFHAHFHGPPHPAAGPEIIEE